MSFHFPSLAEIETEIGVIKVDINHVIAKLVAGVQVVAHEADVLFREGLAQESKIAGALNAAAPIISAVGAVATTAATGNPALGKVAALAITAVNAAFNDATKAIAAMNAANSALQANASAGTLAADGAALLAGVQAVTGANSKVANVTSAALTAVKTIQAAAAAVASAPATAPAPAPAS